MVFDWSLVFGTFEQVGLLAAGFTVYAFVVYAFYKHGSKRHLIASKKVTSTGVRGFFARLGFALKFLLLTPLILFAWAAIIALMLFLLADAFTAEKALLVAIALLSTIRITAYFSEELSADVAKLLPLSLLAVVLFDSSKINFAAFVTKVIEMPLIFGPAITAFAFVVLLELVLRIGHAFLAKDV